MLPALLAQHAFQIRLVKVTVAQRLETLKLLKLITLGLVKRFPHIQVYLAECHQLLSALLTAAIVGKFVKQASQMKAYGSLNPEVKCLRLSER